MTNQEIVRLAAKDALVRHYGGVIKHWTLEVWEENVESFVQQIGEYSPGRQAEIRMRYKT